MTKNRSHDPDTYTARGKKITDKLMLKLDVFLDENSRIIAAIKDDIRSVRERDPAARSDGEVFLLYSGVHAVLCYRVAHKLYVGKHYFPARLLSQLGRFITGIEIHPAATIGKRLFIDHGMGVVIGETTVIGDDCTLYQGVTLGGTGKHIGKRHPTLGNNVMVGAGARVLGPVRIGNNSKVAAGAVVLSEIPDNCTAVGIPARVVRCGGKKVEALDQIHIPDPVAQELCRMNIRVETLEKQLDELKSTPSTSLKSRDVIRLITGENASDDSNSGNGDKE